MKIIIDEQDDLVSVKEGELASVITDKIEPLLYSSGKVIQKINFNEEDIDIENIESSCAKKKFSESDVLNIKTNPLKDQLFLILDNVATCLDKAEEDAIEISENILKTDNKDSLNKLASWCGDISDLIQNIDSFLSAFSVDIKGLKLNNKNFNESIKDITGFLDEINKALENNDKTTIADLIEFEVSPIVVGLKEILPLFKKRLDEVFDAQQK